MATKSRNDWTLFWSLIALAIAAVSIAYCFTYILDLINEGSFRSTRIIAQFARSLKGDS